MTKRGQFPSNLQNSYNSHMEPPEDTTDESQAWVSKIRIWVKSRLDFIYGKCKEVIRHTSNICILFKQQKIFRWGVRFRYLLYKISQHTKFLRHIFLVICAVILAYFLIQFTDLTDPKTASISSFADYLSTIGAMVGGVLAVVFSLTIFGQQSILDVHSTKLLHKYVYGIREKSTFFGISFITLLFFVASRWSANVIEPNPVTYSILIYGSSMLVAVVFVLVDLLYQRVSGKSSSAEIFGFLQKESLAVLKKIDKYSQRLVNIGVAEGRVKKQEVQMGLLKAQSRAAVSKTFRAELDEKLKVIYEITVRLIARKEYEPANNGLRTLHAVIREYLLLVKDSSTSIPANSSSLGVLGLLARQSDSVDFLNTNLERLARIGEQNVLNENVQNLQLVTDVFKALVAQAESINHVGNDTENYILPLIIGYQTEYLEFAILQNNLESVWQTAQALDNMAGSAVRGKSQQAQQQIRESIDKVILFGIKNDRSFVINECMNAVLVSIMSLFHDKMPYAYTSIDDSLKQVAAKTELIYVGVKTGILTDQFTTTHFFTQWLIHFPVLINQYQDIVDKREKESYREKLIQTTKGLQRQLRHISENIKDVDNPLVEVIGRVIDAMGEYLIYFLNHPDFIDEKREIEKVLYGYIHLPGWFVHHATTYEKNNQNRSLVEAITKIGIFLFEKYRDERLIEACIDSLFTLVKALFEKNPKSYLFDEARVMVKICYLGVLARKHSMKRLYALVRVKILEFDRLYAAAYQKELKKVPQDLRAQIEARTVYGFPDKERLKQEVFAWRNDVYRDTSGGMARMMGDSRGIVQDSVTIEDIDWFMWEVWSEIDASSSISDKIDLQWARERLSKTLRKIADGK